MRADTILVNGKIYSVGADNKRKEGSAVAILGEKIAAVGNDDEIMVWADEKTKIIDCNGKTILPGLCDGHCHPSWTASFYIACDLFNVVYEDGEDVEDIIKKYTDRVAKYIKNHPEAKIIKGIGWNPAHFNGATGKYRMPTRQDLDKISSDIPIILDSYCQHNIWVNTKAIEIAGIDENTETPDSGVILREENGYPQGIFQQMSAIAMIREGIPGYDYTVGEYKETLLRYQREQANIYGVTMLQDCMCTSNARQAYMELAKEGKLTLRARGVHVIDASSKEKDIEDLIKDKGKFDYEDAFQINTAKFFLEGDFSMLEPYEPEILKELGLPEDYVCPTLWNLEECVQYFEKAMNAGFQIHCHAMGDASIKLGVDGIERARKLVDKSVGRDVIAHVMAIPKGYFKKMGDMKLICAAQPRWSIWDSDVEDFYIPYVGKDRALDFYPIKRFTDAGCTVVYGTDFPVTPPPNPFHELQCAITRSVFKDAADYERFKEKMLGKEDAPKEDCVTMDEAIKSLTYNGAYEMFMEEITGSIEVGKSADIVILKNDLEKTPVDELYDTKVHKTFFKGKLVYEA